MVTHKDVQSALVDFEEPRPQAGVSGGPWLPAGKEEHTGISTFDGELDWNLVPLEMCPPRQQN